MKHKRGILKTIAMMLAVILALSDGKAVSHVVYASYDNTPAFSAPSLVEYAAAVKNTENESGGGKTDLAGSEDPKNLQASPNSIAFETSAASETPIGSGAYNVSANLIDSENSNDPGKDVPGDSNKDNPNNPNNLADPENSQNPGTPENPDDSGEDIPDDLNKENPDDPGEDTLGDLDKDKPDDSENPGIPEKPEDPENSEDLEAPENSDNLEEEELQALSLEDGDYGTVTQSGECGIDGDNVTWAYYADTRTLVISGVGAMANYTGSPFYSLGFTHLVIEEGITAIGEHCFRNCKSLEGQILFPETVTSIGNHAFYGVSNVTEMIFNDFTTTLEFSDYALYGCNALRELHLPEQLVNFSVTGSYTYNGCNLTELTIPGNLKDGTITPSMFKGLGSLTKLTIEEGITTIETDGNNSAFNMSNLVEVHLPDSLAEIPQYMFSGAGKLTKINPIEGGCQVNIPMGVKSIGNRAFQNCTALGTAGEGENQGRIMMPESLEEIGEYAFYWNRNIKAIIFDDATQSLEFGEGAFMGCGILEELHLPEELVDFNVTNNNAFSGCNSLTELVVPGSLRDGKITPSMFKGLGSLARLTIEEGITTIETGTSDSAFSVGNLVEVHLPDSLTEIPQYMFANAGKLTKINPIEGGCQVNIPMGVKSIGNRAFQNCTALGSTGEGENQGRIMMPESLERIGDNAFYSGNANNSIKAIIFDDATQSLEFGEYAFHRCTALEELHLPEELVDFNVTNNNAFSGCDSLTELVVPGSLRDGKITPSMFKGLGSLARLTIEEGITTIETGTSDSAFNVGNLVEVHLPDSLTEIPQYMFANAGKLTKINPIEGGCQVNIPMGVKSIGNFAFRSCTSLGTAGEGEDQGRIMMPESLEEIGEYAFGYAKNIKAIIFDDATRTLQFGNYAFDDCVTLEELHLPEQLVDFCAANNTFRSCSSLTELVVPGSLRDGKITATMFKSMNYLKKLTIEEGITTIETGTNDSAFSVGNLVEVHLPDSLTEIPHHMFSGAGKLTKINPIEGGCQVNIPMGVKSIGNQAFNNCTVLGTAGEGENQGRITMPEKLEKIGENAFSYAKNIKAIIFDDATQSLQFGAYAFYMCSALEELHLPEQLVDFYAPNRHVFNYCDNLRELVVPGNLRDGKITTTMFRNIPHLEKLTIEEGITTIEKDAFYVGWMQEVYLPDSLTMIPESMFNNAPYLAKINPTADRNVNLPGGIESIGNNAFNSCPLLTGELHLPDSLESMGSYVFLNSNFSSLHTSATPPAMPGYISSRYRFDSIWFRGRDDRDSVELDGKSYGWARFFDEFTRNDGGIPRLYIDTDAKHLTSQTFWQQFTDITFVGPNVITLEKTGGDIFSSVGIPLSRLDGTYYVTEEGVLYALNPIAGTAALAYCPPGITELHIPASFTVTGDLPEEEQYARSYRVASVLQHSIMQASDLTAITAANPRQITLSMRAFADCPTLTSVNGVTTQKEANALFGTYGTLAIKKAFENTGLDPDDSPDIGLGGQPMRELTYTEPNAGRLTISLIDKEELEYRDGAYRLLTGTGAGFTLSAEAYGKGGDFMTPFRIYFQPSADQLQFYPIGEISRTTTSGGQSYTTTITTSYDKISGCYCCAFSLPSGGTLTLSGLNDSGNKLVRYPGRISPGGELCVWGEVLPVTDLPVTGDEGAAELPDSANYMMLDWSTQRNLYEMELKDRENQATINSSTHRPWFYGTHFIPSLIIFREDGELNGNTDIGKDPVTQIWYRYTIKLPQGMVWNDEEKIRINPNPNSTGKIVGISDDRSTLIYELTYPINDYRANITNSSWRLYDLDLGYTRDANSPVVITDSYDYYSDSAIEFEGQGRVYYQYSEPDEMQKVTGREILLAVEDGEVELSRGYRFEDERGSGRGLPVTSYFKATNRSKEDAIVDLASITDEVINYNGYMYLSAGQMAGLILDENEYIKTSRIEISEAVLYEGGFLLGGTHIGSDGIREVYENRLNTYSQPKKTNAKLVFEIARDEQLDPMKLTFTIDGADELVIEDLPGDRDGLETVISRVLEEAGYVVPTGLYRITWNATEKLREHPVEAYDGEWEIGSYQATVKLDYEQAHHWIRSDTEYSFNLFYNVYYNQTARALFTLYSDSTHNSTYTVEHTTRDSYLSSSIRLAVQYYNTVTERFESGMGESHGISPGNLLMYTDTYTNENSVVYEDLPFRQEIDSNQALLAPCCDGNSGLEGLFEKTEVFGKDYYVLEPGSETRELNGVWLGCDEGVYFYAETVTLGRRESEDGSDKGEAAVIQWYEKSIGERGGTDNVRTYHFYTRILDPVRGGERPGSTTTVYANNYKNEDYSARIYGRVTGTYRSETIGKDILINPKEAGTEKERIDADLRSTYIGTGESVTYRLRFDAYWANDYTLEAGRIYDMLPDTAGWFEWELGRNVHVKYALKMRIGTEEYEPYAPTGEGGQEACHIEKRMAKENGIGAEKELYHLVWDDLVLPPGRTLYIYVTLDFPDDGEVWNGFVDAADTSLYNTFCMVSQNGNTVSSSIEHRIARPTQAFLKIGMYGTDSDPYGYIYPNSDETNRQVRSYLVIYNHGKSDMYLNPVHVKIPEGYTLKVPPKWYDSAQPNWNCSDVSVTDEEPPTSLVRVSVVGVGVTYSEDKREAVLDIKRDGYNYDPLVDKYYLKPGEYVVVDVRFDVDGYQFTKDLVGLAAAMPVDDSHHVGRIVQVDGVDAHKMNYQNTNEGTREFWDSDGQAQERGFMDPDPSDTGKWVASQLMLRREEAKPGLVKDAPVIKQVGDDQEPYNPQKGVAMEHPVKWVTRLENGGRNSLTDYRIKDTIQWPYVFDGEVTLATQGSGYDRTFTIQRFYTSVLVNGAATEAVDRDRLKINYTEIGIADSRQEALEDPDSYSMEVFGGARVYFYKEDAFDDGNLSETMEIDLTSSRVYGIGPASYQNGRIVEAVRTLSYWTKFDLSKKNDAVRSSYGNKMILYPQQPYTKADVYAGIAIDEEGNPVINPDDQPDGILAVNYVSVNVGQATLGWMTVKEDKEDDRPDGSLTGTDDLTDLLTRENKILLEDTGHTVTYTMHVLNDVANYSDVVQNPDDRMYSIKDMVIINVLPYIGDRMPFDSRVPRDSAFEMDADSFQVKLYYYDNKENSSGNAEDMELLELDEKYYTVLYSEKQRMDSADWAMSGTPPGWYTAEEFQEQVGDITKMKSIRIELHDPTTEFDPSNPGAYRELMKPGRTIVAKYQARISERTPTSPGQCAWNSFGYRFERFDGSAPLEASSIRTGVQIPAIPILYEKLIDYYQNPYVNPGEPQTFQFVINKKEGQKTEPNGTITYFRPQQITFSVTVDTGSSENNRELDKITEEMPDITWVRLDGDTSPFWENDATYTVSQVACPEEFPFFSVMVNDQPVTEFVYNASYEPVIVYKNQNKDWGSTLYKMDKASEGYDPANDRDIEHITFLPGAMFALYTTDEGQKLDLSALTPEAGDKYALYQLHKNLLETAKEVSLNDGTSTRLYLKDFGVTGGDGIIKWINLEDDRYYVREIAPPEGFRLDAVYYKITRNNPTLAVYNEPGEKLLVTGGIGTGPFYMAGAALLLAGAVLAVRRRRSRWRVRNGRK